MNLLIFVGIALIVIIIFLLLAQKFAIYSELMNGFKSGAFKKILIILSIISVLSLSFGIYLKETEKQTFMIIKVNGVEHVIFGDIGNIGYYTKDIITKNKEITLYLATWNQLDSKQEHTITVKYPSGKTEIWETKWTKIENKSKSEVKEIYQLEPYTFKESGRIKLELEKNKEISIKVNNK